MADPIEPPPSDEELDDGGPAIATRLLAIAWVLVFLAMAWSQGSLQASASNWLSGGIGARAAHQFGAMTTAEIRDGQVWRLLTATGVHFSFVHLIFNLVMLVQLGRFVEPWYGPGTFLGLYVVVGVLGNAIAAFAKPYSGHALDELSGGGSGVLCGLIALLAVVGWRSRTRYGSYVQKQMIGLLVFIAIMGRVIPNVGNWEHAGGAIAGAVMGFMHRPLLRAVERRGFRLAVGLLALATLGASVTALVRSDRREARELADLTSRLQARVELSVLVLRIERAQRRLAIMTITSSTLGELGTQRQELAGALAALATLADRLGSGPETRAIEVFRQAAAPALTTRPTPGQVVAFQDAARALVALVNAAQQRDAQRLRSIQQLAHVPPPARALPAPPQRPPTAP